MHLNGLYPDLIHSVMSKLHCTPEFTLFANISFAENFQIFNFTKVDKSYGPQSNKVS